MGFVIGERFIMKYTLCLMYEEYQNEELVFRFLKFGLCTSTIPGMRL